MCGGINVIKYGISESGKQRYYCKDTACSGKSFQLEHCYTGCEPGINDKIMVMAANEKQTSYEIQFDVILYENVEQAELDEMCVFQGESAMVFVGK